MCNKEEEKPLEEKNAFQIVRETTDNMEEVTPVSDKDVEEQNDILSVDDNTRDRG